MTTVKPGDLVRFIDEVGEGRVVRIVSDELAEVETSDGWILPAYIRTLVVIPEKDLPGKTTGIPAKPKEIKAAILEKEIAGTAANKNPVSKPSNPKTPPREVDLHINKLMDSVVGMTNTEILTVQLDVFRRELNLAIRNNEREIIFIHGIGNGTLKTEIRRVAGQEYKWCSQEDASFREYGFGATRIRIPQNKPIY
jgi:dsDNA-specific endonuclease/ATPase MutS2